MSGNKKYRFDLLGRRNPYVSKSFELITVGEKAARYPRKATIGAENSAKIDQLGAHLEENGTWSEENYAAKGAR